MSRPRIYTDEERKQRAKECRIRNAAKVQEGVERSRREIKAGRKIKHEQTTVKVGVKVESAAWRWARKMKHSANMCNIAARLWLMERGRWYSAFPAPRTRYGKVSEWVNGKAVAENSSRTPEPKPALAVFETQEAK